MTDPDKCAGCPTRDDSEAIPIPGTLFWYHSPECMEKELNKYLPKEYMTDSEGDAAMDKAIRHHAQVMASDPDAYWKYLNLSPEKFDEWVKTTPTQQAFERAREDWRQRKDQALEEA